jgi:transaldolase
MKQDYEIKFQQFLNENQHLEFPFEELKRVLMDYEGEEEKEEMDEENEGIIEKYLKALKFDLEKDMAEYNSWEIEDFVEDFENYKTNKLSL